MLASSAVASTGTPAISGATGNVHNTRAAVASAAVAVTLIARSPSIALGPIRAARGAVMVACPRMVSPAAALVVTALAAAALVVMALAEAASRIVARADTALVVVVNPVAARMASRVALVISGAAMQAVAVGNMVTTFVVACSTMVAACPASAAVQASIIKASRVAAAGAVMVRAVLVASAAEAAVAVNVTATHIAARSAVLACMVLVVVAVAMTIMPLLNVDRSVVRACMALVAEKASIAAASAAVKVACMARPAWPAIAVAIMVAARSSDITRVVARTTARAGVARIGERAVASAIAMTTVADVMSVAVRKEGAAVRIATGMTIKNATARVAKEIR
jgi:hypothetical protein